MMKLTQCLTNNTVKFCIFLLSLLVVQTSVAENFDQQYAVWKAKQQAIDARLRPIPDHANTQTLSAVPSYTAAQDKIRLNSASAAQLMQLHGVGEKKALQIIEYRQKNGGFKRIEDIQNVKGIGIALFEKNKMRLAL
jgi:competence protein ComEA